LLTAGEAIEAARRAVAERRQLPAPLVPNGTLPAGLSQREVEVIRLVATGMSNAEAADALFLSRRTVDAHLRRIYDKLDLASRTELARFAREHALLEVPQEDAPAGSTRHGAAGT
jgi:DNA-binding NarL/FixJ family response regulator